MLKKTLISLVVSLGLTTGVVASDKLKVDMGKLASSISEAQAALFLNDKAATLAAVIKLRKETKEILGDEKTIKSLLPVEMQYKASIAINSAGLIAKYASQIEDTLNDKNMRMINQQMRTQKAFTDIQNQCFRCHNLVRDWGL